jgi:hypothetical protein
MALAGARSERVYLAVSIDIYLVQQQEYYKPEENSKQIDEKGTA